MPTEFTEKPVSSKSRKSQLSSRKSSSKGPSKTPTEPEKQAEETAPKLPAEDIKEEPKETDFTTGEQLFEWIRNIRGLLVRHKHLNKLNRHSVIQLIQQYSGDVNGHPCLLAAAIVDVRDHRVMCL